MHKVSVIIPTYNYAKYVRGAIESALAQTYRPIEIIVVDDGSIDNTRDVLSDYISKGNINYLYQNNKGPSAARNAGLKISKGEYISFLDADDLIDKRKLEIQVKCLENHAEYGVAFSDFRLFKEDDLLHLIPPHIKFSGELTFNDLISGKAFPPHTTLVRREVFDKVGIFDESLKECEDPEFWMRALIAGTRFYYVDQVLSFYRIHSQQAVQNQVKIYRTFLKVIERYQYYDQAGTRMALGKYGQLLGKLLIYENRMQEGRVYLWNYIWYKKDKMFRMFLIIILSYLFSGRAIRRLTGEE